MNRSSPVHATPCSGVACQDSAVRISNRSAASVVRRPAHLRAHVTIQAHEVRKHRQRIRDGPQRSIPQAGPEPAPNPCSRRAALPRPRTSRFTDCGIIGRTLSAGQGRAALAPPLDGPRPWPWTRTRAVGPTGPEPGPPSRRDGGPAWANGLGPPTQPERACGPGARATRLR